MQSIFKNTADTHTFANQGFLIKNALDKEDVAALKNLYQRYFPQGTENFYSSTFLQDITLKKEISKQIVEVLKPFVDTIFENYRLLGAQFLIKNSGNGGTMPFHQDWTVVDENNYRSTTAWIALQDIDQNNGAIKVVPGSQEFSRALRGPGNFDRLHLIQNELENYAQVLPMQSGTAFIFDHALIHGSGANRMPEPRMAVALGLVHKEAELFFHHKTDDNHLATYRVKEDFFITFPNKGAAPEEAECLSNSPANFEKVTPEEFKIKMDEIIKQQSELIKYPALFKDANLQAQFENDGYVKAHLLNQEEVADLKAFYLNLNHDHIGQNGFHISLDNKNPDYVQAVFKKLFAVFTPKLDELLVNYKTFTASYVIKEAGLQNVVPPHQDWTFVDEKHFCSATVWVPLMDVNKNNGALGIIKGSHKLFNAPRPSPSPQAPSALSHHAFTLFPYVEVIEMKAGEVLIFNNKTIHASPPNISGHTRIAAGIGITQKEAQLQHHYQLPGNEKETEVYAVEEPFFLEYSNGRMSALYDAGQKPNNLKVVARYNRNIPPLSKEEVIQKVTLTEGVKVNTALMEELAALYNYNADGTPKIKTPTPEPAIEMEATMVESPAQAYTDNRGFFEKYSPANILAEIKYRISK